MEKHTKRTFRSMIILLCLLFSFISLSSYGDSIMISDNSDCSLKLISIGADCTRGLSGITNNLNTIEKHSIKFTIGGKTYAYNVFVMASPIKKYGNTSISIATTLPEAASLSLNFIFDGASTGTYSIESGFDPSRRNEPGLGFRFAQPTKRLDYDLEAQKITVKIDTYTIESNGRPTVEGTFSGILINKETGETFELTDGFFSTMQKTN